MAAAGRRLPGTGLGVGVGWNSRFRMRNKNRVVWDLAKLCSPQTSMVSSWLIENKLLIFLRGEKRYSPQGPGLTGKAQSVGGQVPRGG